jgi:uncharacterized linocin/CFP29 family protein
MSTCCRLAFERMERVDRAVDHKSVAEAASKGVLAALRVVQARCEAEGVPDVLLAEVVRSWAEILGGP